MSSGTHRRGLSRLLLGAALLLLGWLLMSATPASADDTLTSVVGGATEPVTSAADSVADGVAAVVEDLAAPAAEPVARPLAATVEHAAEAVSDDVDATATTTVQASTAAVEATVEATPVAPEVARSVTVVTEVVRDTTTTLSADIVEPVVETVVSGVGAVSGLPVEDVLPALLADVPGVTSGQAGSDTDTTVGPAAAKRPGADGIRVAAPTSSLATPGRAELRPSVGNATAGAAGTPHRPVRGPVPTGPETGLLPAPSNSSTGGSAGADAACTPLAFTLPSATSVSPLHAVQHPAAGPVPDPGSRPD